MFRTSGRHLARCAGLTLRSIALPSSRAARIAPRAPAATAFLAARRYNSTNNPQRPDQNDDHGSQDFRPRRQLPEGWVYLTEEEMQQLQKFINNLPSPNQRAQMAEAFREVKEIGVPVELRDILQRALKGEVRMRDALQIPRIAFKIVNELSEQTLDAIDAAKRDGSISRAKPNDSETTTSSQPQQQQSQDQQQGQLSAQQREQSSVQQQQQQQPQQPAQQAPEQQAAQQSRQQEQQQHQQQSPPPSQQQQQQQQQQRSAQQQQVRQQQRQQGGSGKGQKPEGPGGYGGGGGGDFIIQALIALAIYAAVQVLWGSETSREMTWQDVRSQFLDKGLVEKLTVYKDRVKVHLNAQAVQAVYPDGSVNPNLVYYFSIGSVDAFERRLEEAQRELGIPPSERIPVTYAREGQMHALIQAFGPTLLLVGLLVWLTRKGVSGNSGYFGFGKSRAKMFNHDTQVKVKFSDVAGMDEAKTEIMEFVSFLKNPERFQRLGAKIPRGAILSGPPGTGKTLLAKATAGESNVPFFSVSGSEFVEMFVGVGASRVRDLFATARKNAPCIIFIDEIDAIGRSRSEGGGFRSGGNDEREATLNQILTEMDGFNTTEQVVVLAGTNRPDILDQALMRPGRFDRHIHIDRPTMKGRQDIFKVHLRKIKTNEDMEYLCGRLAALTPGFAGADIANAVNEAALIAARANAESVQMIHFEQAIERVIGGLERKSLILSPEEKRTVAYHEAGHAICGWYFRWADPLLKVSIIPRGQGALGYAQYLPASDAYLMTENQLMDRMAMTLGGRVSEELHFPTVTTGASDDFKKVTRMATTMVTQWGMSKKLGPLHYNQDQNQLHKPFAEATAQEIDAEVRRIVDQAYKQCRDLLEAKKKEIGLVAEELLRKEVLTRDDLVRLLGPRQWPEKEEFSKYFDGSGGKSTTPPFPTESTDSPPVSGPEPAAFEEQKPQEEGNEAKR